MARKEVKLSTWDEFIELIETPGAMAQCLHHGGNHPQADKAEVLKQQLPYRIADHPMDETIKKSEVRLDGTDTVTIDLESKGEFRKVMVYRFWIEQ